MGRNGTIISIIILSIILFSTLKFSGHKHSLGLLFIGLIILNFFALLLLTAGWQFKILKTKFFFIYVSILIIIFFGFIIFHNSYDSYNETRSILLGFNGEENLKKDIE